MSIAYVRECPRPLEINAKAFKSEHLNLLSSDLATSPPLMEREKADREKHQQVVNLTG
jgi:hypothetical protein